MRTTSSSSKTGASSSRASTTNFSRARVPTTRFTSCSARGRGRQGRRSNRRRREVRRMSTTQDQTTQTINLRKSRHVLRRMLRFGYPYRWHLLLALLLLIGSIVTDLAQPYLVKVAIDSYIDVPDPDVDGLIRLMLIYFVVVVAAFGLN